MLGIIIPGTCFGPSNPGMPSKRWESCFLGHAVGSAAPVTMSRRWVPLFRDLAGACLSQYVFPVGCCFVIIVHCTACLNKSIVLATRRDLAYYCVIAIVACVVLLDTSLRGVTFVNCDDV